MRQIRQGTFETNSSSSHSLVLMKGDTKHYSASEAWEEVRYSCKYDDGYFNPYDDMYFGRSPFQVLYTFRDKLRYAYACAPHRMAPESRKNKRGYRPIWAEYYKVDREVRKLIPQWKGLSKRKRRDGYIGTDDHCLASWLKKANISLLEFLTNKNIIVICDGDEYCIWSDMKRLGVLNTENFTTIPEKEWWEEDQDEDIDVTEEILETYKKEGED
ncbi:MAG: hypothetical protein J6A25_01130 [Lachnospiraceae bacterium]|nr:hypothetical protein [Lachnospiraceae bacterium]